MATNVVHRIGAARNVGLGGVPVGYLPYGMTPQAMRSPPPPFFSGASE